MVTQNRVNQSERASKKHGVARRPPYMAAGRATGLSVPVSLSAVPGLSAVAVAVPSPGRATLARARRRHDQ
eukprot:scaffold6986_cov109-Isochrysis_galbana.AAC.6